MKRINIPFLASFKEPMLSGSKTTTARTKKYGWPGDKFEAWGETFELREVIRVFLSTVRDQFYQFEGFANPHDFVTAWTKLHPIKGFDPTQAVYLHSFRKVKKGEAMMMDIKEFNLRFLAALDRIDPKLLHTASGSNRRHPRLRAVLLKAVKEDIQTDGLEAAIEKWKYFVGVSNES
ncbi:hypothetical protein ES703_41252 [subsurface metagenome]